jgi:hypothetical protein
MPNASTAATVAATSKAPTPKLPMRRLTRCSTSPATDSSQAKPRASGPRRKTNTDKASIASQRWPWW